MPRPNKISRAWYYFRNGWSVYVAFIFAAINTLTVTYYLAIEKIPFLMSIFPTFYHYVMISVGIGIPILVIIGYIHFKRSSAYLSETSINFEANPYTRRTLVNSEIILKLNHEMLELLLSLNKFSDDEKERITQLKKEIEKFIPRRNFSDKSDIAYLKSMYEKKNNLDESK